MVNPKKVIKKETPKGEDIGIEPSFEIEGVIIRKDGTKETFTEKVDLKGLKGGR